MKFPLSRFSCLFLFFSEVPNLGKCKRRMHANYFWGKNTPIFSEPFADVHFPLRNVLKKSANEGRNKIKNTTCSTNLFFPLTISLPSQVLSNLGPHCNEEGSNRQNNYRKKIVGDGIVVQFRKDFLGGGGWVVKTGRRAIVQVWWCMPNMEQRNNNSKLSFFGWPPLDQCTFQ